MTKLRYMGRVRRGYEAAKKGVVIQFGVYNIWNGYNDSLDSALHVMYQANIYLGFLQ